MLRNFKKLLYSGLAVCSAAAILNIAPATVVNAQESSNAAVSNSLGDGGISSFLSVLGNSYDVRPVDSEIMGLVVEQAHELDIDFDISMYQSEYENFAIARVTDFINVRAQASIDAEVLGHMYNGSVCEIMDRVECEDGVWFRIVSGSLEGFVKSDYFIYGNDALDVIEDYVSKVAVVKCNVLNVRSGASADSAVIGSVCAGDKIELVKEPEAEESEDTERSASEASDRAGAKIAQEDEIIEDDDYYASAERTEAVVIDIEKEIATLAEDEENYETEWVKVQYTQNLVGYVCAEYVTIEESYVSGKTIAEEKAEAEAKAAAEKRRQQAAAAAAAASVAHVEDTTIAHTVATYENTSELRQSLVDYAKSYEGTRYIMGGQSLSGGTDCSGFTCYVYAEYGYTIGRTPSSQWANAGRSISYDEIQPGDIVCFGTSNCYHVAIYIGDGMIVHEANSRMGCIISSINFEPILGYKNVID